MATQLVAPARRHRLGLVAAAVFLVMLSGFGLLITRSQRDARQALTDRFAIRTNLTASFARGYIDDVADRERRQAERLLAGPRVDQATFERVAEAFDFDAVVLLDQRGRLLNVWPPKPAIIGKDMTVEYPHLRVAIEHNTVGVSSAVRSAAQRLAVTAVAVPYQSSEGRRVFSGAFTLDRSPLSAYFASVVTASGGTAVLVDDQENVLATSRKDALTPGVQPAVHDGVDEVEVGGTKFTVAVARVPGTPLRVVLSSPTDKLYAPVADGRWAPWVLWWAFAAAGFAVLILLVRLSGARAEAAVTARTDALTGLPNRRAMEELLAKAASSAKRHSLPLAALMVDLDKFKAINDSRGHHGGDVVLRHAAQCAERAVRAEDIVGRWGGEEFLVLLPSTNGRGARRVAERLRMAIATEGVPGAPPITASIGLAVLVDGPKELLRDADGALYEAKAAGRNCTVASSTARDPSAWQLVTVSDRPSPPATGHCLFETMRLTRLVPISGRAAPNLFIGTQAIADRRLAEAATTAAGSAIHPRIG